MIRKDNKISNGMKIALLTGGPSLERGISLNSARSVLDHLENDNIEIIPIYFDQKKRAYHISKNQLYSNTPSDFDFKLTQNSLFLNRKSLLKLLKSTSIVFLAMHGPFGEDGQIQTFLEKNNIPFIGSGSKACKMAFDKYKANKFIEQHNFFTLPSVVLKIYHSDHKKIIDKFFKDFKIKRAIVKPAIGGSSIGVFSVSNTDEALEKVNQLFSKRMDTRVVVESFAHGFEFTMIILQNSFGLPIALTPTEIETDYTDYQIFDFRKKYLPTRQVTWHCPPRFSDEIIEKIQAQGEQLFSLFGMRDFARFDGWVLPNGNIWFCDFNPISGMEQNSFLFQQASSIGMTHGDILYYIVKHACNRRGIKFSENSSKFFKQRKKVSILMGGNNSERQVSLMSGTNVWLKLYKSRKYQPSPYLWDTSGTIWQLPYHLCLNHTVEEITENCKKYKTIKNRLAKFEKRARFRLRFFESKNKEEFFEPRKLTLRKFISNSDFVFIALHGGDGENGNLQKLLREKRIKYNGSNEKVSRLCIDKWNTSNFINNLNSKGVSSILGKVVKTRKILKLTDTEIKLFWKKLRKEIGAKTIIVKPRADGCTTGIVHLYSLSDLKKYLKLTAKHAIFIPKQTFKDQLNIIEMPTKQPHDLLFEKFVETDVLRVKANRLKYSHRTGFIEITVGVIGVKNKVKAFNPSITIAEGDVLTVEEKFQGGTGVNITPPPVSIIKTKTLQKVKNLIEKIAQKAGIESYSRIDAFVNIISGDLLIIEINTLPGLTPSTVLFHQALAENPPIFPLQLLEKIIKNARY